MAVRTIGDKPEHSQQAQPNEKQPDPDCQADKLVGCSNLAMFLGSADITLPELSQMAGSWQLMAGS